MLRPSSLFVASLMRRLECPFLDWAVSALSAFRASARRGAPCCLLVTASGVYLSPGQISYTAAGYGLLSRRIPFAEGLATKAPCLWGILRPQGASCASLPPLQYRWNPGIHYGDISHSHYSRPTSNAASTRLFSNQFYSHILTASRYERDLIGAPTPRPQLTPVSY